MELSRERAFEELLSALSAADPLESLTTKAAQLCGGAGLLVNELGEVVRSVGSAPAHLISRWLMSEAPETAPETAPGSKSARPGSGGAAEDTQWTAIGRWDVAVGRVRVRQRDYAMVLAVLSESADGSTEVVELCLDMMAKLLGAFEGFEAFSVSTRREESARMLRDLETGVSPGREPAAWRLLENFGFSAYEPVRVARVISSLDEGQAGSERPRRTDTRVKPGIIINESGSTPSTIEHTALCSADFSIGDFFAGNEPTGMGVSEPFSALSQMPDMVRTADVALLAARSGRGRKGTIYVDEMRPYEWAAARLSSRHDRKLVKRFFDPLVPRGDILDTVIRYFERDGNVAATATMLQIHENTVRYRLSQAERLLDRKLSDPRTIADLVIALECRGLDDGRRGG